MTKVDSTVCDCYHLSEQLLEKFGSRLVLYGCGGPCMLAGEYASFSNEVYSDYTDLCENKIIFCCKYYKGEFLRITVGNGLAERPIGHKLAALSDFYEIFKEEFGVPTLFYTMKDDAYGSLNFQWSMKDKEKDIENFKNGTIFCDTEVEHVIVMGEKKIDLKKRELDRSTQNVLDEGLGLPIDLLPLVNDNIDDFIYYKEDKDVVPFDSSKQNQKVYTYTL